MEYSKPYSKSDWPRPGLEGWGDRLVLAPVTIVVFHNEVRIEDFQYDRDSETYFYPCPCRVNFCIAKEDLEKGEDVAACLSCSLIIKVINDKDQFTCGETVPAPSINRELVKC
ncbi:diphthamide biosynthesis protein 3-like [Camelus bactrianus]|uniref:Diphthamide biosynthesis protein 3 n=1 Tax=Camelus bactrianus TaxID=9837 RepID=A0A9W3GGG1_CAMBA|nr:DPH3 homolog [Camelus bactrianus]